MSKKKPQRLLSDEELNKVALHFRVLGEPMRLKILQAVCQEARAVNDIVAAVGATQANVSKHLALLAAAGVLTREKFERAGFDRCVLVEGGTQAWIDAGLPVIRGTSKTLPLMRQVQIVVGLVSATGAALALAVNHRFAIIPLLMGCGLLFAGLTGTCGLALLLAKMPWNRAATCEPVSCCAPKN